MKHLTLRIKGELPDPFGGCLDDICALDNVEWDYHEEPDPVTQTFTVKVTSPEGFEPVTEELLNVVLARYWMGGLRRAEVTEVEP